MGSDDGKKLRLSFHGRIIDSLGIQMYQSPVAAVAELIANAWDADATSVAVTLPLHNDDGAEIVVADTGRGMTFDECQDRYLNVGRNRRLADGQTSPGGRSLLGRKGIGNSQASESQKYLRSTRRARPPASVPSSGLISTSSDRMSSLAAAIRK